MPLIYRRHVEALLNGEYLAKWQFTQEEWERFLHTEWTTSKRRALKWAGYLGAAGLAGGLLPAIGDFKLVDGLMVGISMAALFGGLIPGLVLLAAWSFLKSGLRSEPQVLIGPTGAYLCERYLSWGSDPRSVKLVPGAPAVLSFELHGRSSFDGPPTVRIPVPTGSEAEAARLRDRFRQHIRTNR